MNLCALVHYTQRNGTVALSVKKKGLEYGVTFCTDTVHNAFVDNIGRLRINDHPGLR
jgi:hypothetical protein